MVDPSIMQYVTYDVVAGAFVYVGSGKLQPAYIRI